MARYKAERLSGAAVIQLLWALLLSGCGYSLFSPATAVQSASTQTFSVTTYGAKGDGIADDAPAIERAIQSAAAAGGGHVLFPCGQFSLQSSAGNAPMDRSLLYIRSATAVQLLGQGHCTHLFTTLPQKTVLEFEDSDHILITNLYITPVNGPCPDLAGMDGGSAIRFANVNFGGITQVEADGASSAAFYFTKATSNSSITDNFVHDTYASAIWEDDCSGISATTCEPSRPPVNNTYLGNTLTNTSLAMQTAISMDDGSNSTFALVKGNTISWTRPILPSKWPPAQCIQANNTSDASILDNTCTNTPSNGIVVTTGDYGRSNRILIQGNTLTNTGTIAAGGHGVDLYDAPKGFGINGFNVSYNTITTTANDAIHVQPWQPGNIQNGQVLNNTISLADQLKPGSAFGIDIQNSASITISSNTIACNGKCIAVGVFVQQSPGTTPTASADTVSNILGPPLIIR